MKVLLSVMVFSLAPLTLSAQNDWRFGFEYNENWPLWSPRWAHPAHAQLLAKLAMITPRGAINVNGIGNWSAIQPSESHEYNFAVPDSIVRLFQAHGFELTWYLNCEARWAWVNPNPSPAVRLGASMAPAPDKEDDWQAYVRAVVERYDGDGTDDMPGLTLPIRFYLMPGEVKFDKSGLGDEESPAFWADTIDNLLRLHRLTHAALRAADPSGNAKLVGSSAVLWDLYADFPDYPAFDSTDGLVWQRLNGRNFRGLGYTQGWSDLKKLLAGLGDDRNGVACDYLGWHPHFSWRVIDQEFRLVRALAGSKPIYVDDMWCNIFAQGYTAGVFPAIPGEAQFNAPPADPPAPIAWVQRLYGDFPNSLFSTLDPHDALRQKLQSGDAAALRWYEANGARQLVKSLVTALGEGAERVSISGSNDVAPLRNPPFQEIGWINLLGTRQEGYREKPQFHTYKLLVEKLRTLTVAARLAVSADPRTRVYKFERPSGPLYVLWSEAGPAPPNLDYDLPTGETVSFAVGTDKLVRTRLITSAEQPYARVDSITAENRQVVLALGHEPFLLEEIALSSAPAAPVTNTPRAFELRQNIPNPFDQVTRISFSVRRTAHVRLELFDLTGRRVRLLFEGRKAPAEYETTWDGRDAQGALLPRGVYFYRLTVAGEHDTRKLIMLRLR